MLLVGKPWIPVYDNNVDAFIPELWANESLMILVENLIAGSLVYRDFEPVLAAYGDTVNTRRPADFDAKRKVVADSVTVQDAVATNVPVILDQHIHTSFLIRDGEESKAFKDLVDEFLRPAVISIARAIDRIVLGQYVNFEAASAGNLAGLTSTTVRPAILNLRTKMNQNKCPLQGRSLILNPVTEGTLLNLDILQAAYAVGDDGTALREASLGRKLGYDMYMDQNMASVLAGQTIAQGTVNNAGGYPAGTTTMTISGLGATAANFQVGSIVVIDGDGSSQTITALTGGPPYTGMSISPGLNAAVANSANITTVVKGTINNAAGYPAGYNKEIAITSMTPPPQIGQSVSFTNDTTNTYTIIDVDGSVGIILDRSLVNAVANGDNVHLGPAGNYSFAFHQNAIALVVRPLAKPKAGTGALSAVVNWNDLSMRVTITYDGNKQGHLVTTDILCGIAVLDKRLGGVLYG